MNKVSMITAVIFNVAVVLSVADGSMKYDPAFENISFRDIPEVTQNEINAIDELRKSADYFKLSVAHSTELFLDQDSNARGYTASLAKWLSDVFEIEFRPVVEELPVIVSELNSGKKIFGYQVITQERLEKYFMTDHIVHRSVKIMRLEGSLPIDIIAKSRTPRYVFLEGTMLLGLFAENNQKGSYEQIIAEDYETVYGILQRGEADAFIGHNVMEVAFDAFGGVISEDFFPLTFIPVAVATGNKELEPFISVINKALRNGAYNHIISLYRQGYSEYKKHRFNMSLTDDEKDYIRNNPVIPFASQYMSYPISFYNKNEGKWEGVVFDVLEEMANITGISFELVNDTATELLDLMKLLEDGTAFFIPNLIQSTERRERFIWPNTMYLKDRFALLSKQNYPNIELNDIPFERVGFAKGSAFADMFRRWFPNAVSAGEYSNTDAAFIALDRGEIDLIMSSQSRLASLTNYYEFSDYKANYLFGAEFESSFGVNKEQAVFCSVIDKALALINTDRILEQWQTKTYNYQARMLREQRVWIIAVSVLLVFALVLIICILTVTYTKKNKMMKAMRRADIAEASNNAKSQFIAVMSHEIRTPMNSIIGFAELASGSDTLPQIKDYLSKITNATTWLLRVINDILDISKIESGRMDLEKIPFDLYDITSRCQSVTLPSVKEKGLDLKIYTEPFVGKKLIGDPVRLYQALTNLLSNAVKFTSSGTVKLSSTVKNCDESGTTVYFEVKDSGIGMNAEQINKIFEPFMQADTSTTRKYGGTGLGLAITKNIVELMGGKLSVISELGVGSTFSFEITFDTLVLSDETSDNSDYKPSQRPQFDALVLVCDDNLMNQEVVCEHLSRLGIKTVVAENGKLGVEKVSERIKLGEKPFDLILMDMFMPVMDGMEAASEINALKTGTPIVAMTANIMLNEVENYKRNGMPDYLPKPFTSKELWSLLLRYLTPETTNII